MIIGTATAAVLLFYFVRTVVRLFRGEHIGSYLEFMLCMVAVLILWAINTN